jgi:hypothetical protein
MTSRIFFSGVAVAALSLLTACGGGDASEDSAANAATASTVAGSNGAATRSMGATGTLTPTVGGIGGSGSPVPHVGGIGGSGIQSVHLAQTCGLQGVDVTIAQVRVNADAAAGPGGPGWIDVALAAPLRTDLLKLGTGDGLPLDLSGLPDGSYRQIRLLLVADDATNPLANAVVADGQETALAVPAGAQGGLPLAATITVARGQVTASLAGLDICKAVSGTAGSYTLDAEASGAATQAATAY